MKKTYNFSKCFVVCAIISVILIALGCIGFFTKGINLGLDFKPGVIEEVIISSDSEIKIEGVRDSLKDFESCQVKKIGSSSENAFQIRLPAVSDEDSSDEMLQTEINSAIEKVFGEGSVQISKWDRISPSFSNTLAFKSLILLLITIALIWAYAAFRFHWDFALGAIIALLHDTLIMFSFIVWTQMEFTTTVLAAILTIIGYSINASVVILDRVRFNITNAKVSKFNEILNISLSETLSRSIITTVTTLFAVFSLYIFTTGSIKDFALAMIAGLISGLYSSIFISSGFISLIRKNWKPEYGIHHSEKSMKKGVLNMNSVVQV